MYYESRLEICTFLIEHENEKYMNWFSEYFKLKTPSSKMAAILVYIQIIPRRLDERKIFF